MRSALRASLAAVLVLACVRPLEAQCFTWSEAFAPQGVDGEVNALAVYDDGDGPALYLAGDFVRAGGHIAQRIARWDGASWSALGTGIVAGGEGVKALAVWDDGTGPALYAAGPITAAGGVAASGVARWDGTSWSALGAGIAGDVMCLAVFDDGGGEALYAGGNFNNAGGAPAAAIARWDGSAWSTVGGGLANGYPRALAVHDDGSGPALYAGGTFSAGNGAVRRWDGTAWTSIGAVAGAVFALAVHDDGGGAELVAAGGFASVGGVAASNIARWDGSAWSPLGTGFQPSSPVLDLVTFDGGGGPELVAAGFFSSAGGTLARGVARWNGSAWSPLGTGLEAGEAGNACLVWEHAGTSNLVVGGSFGIAGGLAASFVATWDGAAWAAVQEGPGGPSAQVRALAVHDDGSGRALYVAGDFDSVGSLLAHDVARWDGSSWSAVGTVPAGADGVFALAVLGEGPDARLYAGGANGVLARWDGSSWTNVGGTTGAIRALLAFDDGSGPALYVGGNFAQAAGAPANNLARFDGVAWSPVGNGLTGGTDAVFALAVHDDGGGPALYAGGTYSAAGGFPANHVARWDGTSWSALGAGIDPLPTFDVVLALASYDDGGGPALYVGGDLAGAAGIASPHVVRWRAGDWSAVGAGVDQLVSALAVYDDGRGPLLYAGGAGGACVLDRYGPTGWEAVCPGPDALVGALAPYDDGTAFGAHLYAGGLLTTAAGNPSHHFARYEGCGHPGTLLCATIVDPTPCPCGNAGLADRGCENSAGTGGAKLDSAGWTSLAFDTLALTSTGELPSALSIFLQGDQAITPAAFGDGLRCAGGALRRLYVRNAFGGAVSAPIAGEDAVSARSAALGDAIPAGSIRVYQVYYRDPDLGFCASPAGNAWNASNALRIGWQP